MILPEHELKVYYPYGGLHYLLAWQSREEGNHIVIAKNEKSITTTFNSLISKHNDLKVFNYFRVNIVAPSEKQCELYAKYLLYCEVDNFWYKYYSIARNYEKVKGSLPPKLTECKIYNPKYKDDFDPNDLKDHGSCLNCTNGITPSEGTKESVYLIHRDHFIKQYTSVSEKRKDNKHRKDKMVKSLASYPDLNKPLYKVYGDFGSHKSGIIGELIDDNNESLFSNSPQLFFYQDLEQLNQETFDKVIAVENEKWKDKEVIRKEIWKQNIIKRERQEFDELLYLFGDVK